MILAILGATRRPRAAGRSPTSLRRRRRNIAVHLLEFVPRLREQLRDACLTHRLEQADEDLLEVGLHGRLRHRWLLALEESEVFRKRFHCVSKAPQSRIATSLEA